MNSEIHVIERVNTPHGELQLQRRNEHFEIISNGTFLMATYNGESERLLVKAPIDLIANPKRVLIGGLGVGFSLAEALKDPRVEDVYVVEIQGKIIEWNQSHLAPFSNHALSDPRTRIVHADLLQWMKETSEKFDVICLDIDNGPDWTVTDENQALYDESGLETLKNLLTPEGIIAFWSASASSTFPKRLQRYFHEVEEKKIVMERGEPDVVYLAK